MITTINNTAYASFCTAYQLEFLGYTPTNMQACYWSTPDNINDEPTIALVSTLFNNFDKPISSLILTAAPSLNDCLDFLRKSFSIYIHVYPLTTPVKNNEKGAYEATGKYGFTINKFDDNYLSSDNMLSYTDFTDIDTQQDAEFTSYEEALNGAISIIANVLYQDLIDDGSEDNEGPDDYPYDKIEKVEESDN